VLLGKGDGSFAAARTIHGVPSAAAIAAADLDGDGRIDLVAAHDGEQRVRWERCRGGRRRRRRAAGHRAAVGKQEPVRLSVDFAAVPTEPG
jgi:hypothetical protein